MTLKQYAKMSKPALIRKITKALRKMPKKRLAMLCYHMTKSKLPKLPLKLKPFQPIGFYSKPSKNLTFKIDKRRKKKRKFSRKQLAAQRLFAKRARAGTLRRR